MKSKRFVFSALALSLLAALLLPTIALAASGGGEGTLIAWGSGKGVVQGNGTISIAGNGNLWIRDDAGDAYIYVSGEGEKQEHPNGWIHYEGFDGRATITGSDVTVVIAGYQIRMYARGSGRFALRGAGGYRTTGSGWTLDTSLIESTPGEAPAER